MNRECPWTHESRVMSHELCEEAILMKHGRGIDRPNKRVLGARSVERGAERGGWKTLITSGYLATISRLALLLLRYGQRKSRKGKGIGKGKGNHMNSQFTIHDSRFFVIHGWRNFFCCSKNFGSSALTEGCFSTKRTVYLWFSFPIET